MHKAWSPLCPCFVPARFVPVFVHADLSLLVPVLSLFCLCCFCPCFILACFALVCHWFVLACPCFVCSYNYLKHHIHSSPFKSILASDRILSKLPKSMFRRLLCRVLINYIFAKKILNNFWILHIFWLEKTSYWGRLPLTQQENKSHNLSSIGVKIVILD